MKEFKVIMEITDYATIQAETAEAALDQVKKQMDPRILGGPVKFQVLEIEPEADTPEIQ